MIQERDR